MTDTVPTILLVDDEKNIRNLLSDALSDEARRVITAETIAGAREMLASERPRLIILDRMLPDGDGLDFCADLRRDPAWDSTPIIIFSARNDDKDKLRALSCGADGYVEKPCDMALMQERVAALLTSRGA